MNERLFHSIIGVPASQTIVVSSSRNAGMTIIGLSRNGSLQSKPKKAFFMALPPSL